MAFVSIVCRELKAFVLEMVQIFWRGKTVCDDGTSHCSPATLGIDGDGLQLAILHDKELRLDDVHLTAHLLPIEQVLHLLRCQMDKDAIVGFDSINKQVGQ